MLVGLDAIEQGTISSSPASLRAAWAPKDAFSSAQRSRRMLLDMALVRAADALDLYISHASKDPKLIQLNEVQDELNSKKHSIYRKFELIEEHYPPSDDILTALIALMIAWRNRAAHSDADIRLDEKYRSKISDNEKLLSEHFSGLDGNLMLLHFEENGDPKFKEIASFINVIQKYVREIEQSMFGKIDQEKYLKDVVLNGVSSSIKNEKDRKKRRSRLIGSVWGKNGNNKRRAVLGFLEYRGISFRDTVIPNSALKFEDELIERLVQQKPKDILQWLGEEV